MRIVLQRVSSASVTIAGEVRGKINAGYVLLLGISPTDSPRDGEWLAAKIATLRLFADESGKMNRSINEIEGGVLVISQFTLFATTRKGTRPSFHEAAAPGLARQLYEIFLTQMTEALGRPVASGEFGADMQVALVNDGPVTLLIDSPSPELAD